MKTLLSIIFILTFSFAPFGTTYTITRSDDRNGTCNSGVDCSLREAVNAANTASTDDTINFAISADSAGCTSGVCTITLTSGEFAVTSASTAGTLTIINSTGASNLLISGNNTSRVFYLNPSANLTITGATITKGNGAGTTNLGFSGYGGGINNERGTLTLTNSTVSDSTAYSGGGIFNQNGTTTLINSIISGNTSMSYTGKGGGIGNNASGTLTLTNSTVSGNAARYGGGIYNIGTLNLTNVTVANNSGDGIVNYPFGTAILNNTIVAGNGVDFSGAVTATSSYNLIGNGLGTTGISNADGNNNQVGSSASPIDPKLGALADNGGSTQTHALLPESPAINAENNANAPATDQRGFQRIVSGIIDIGAFEYQLVARRKKTLLSPTQ